MKKYLPIFFCFCMTNAVIGQVTNIPRKINDNAPAGELIESLLKSKQYYTRLHELKLLFPEEYSRTQAEHPLFSWPLRVSAAYDGIPNYYIIQNFVDDDTLNFLTTEYQCGDRTYDDHRGTDISLWPFWWAMMNENYVQVVAAAPGIVTVAVDDNNNETNCSCNGNNNRITVLHSDSSRALYYHIRDNSLLVKPGDIVARGQPLAYVGSSGCSSNPHLHFEVRASDSTVIDPWVGANPSADCNEFNEETWWLNQKPYREPQINRIMTHSASTLVAGF